MILLANGTIALGGDSASGISGDKSSDNAAREGKTWLINIDTQGNKRWDKTYVMELTNMLLLPEGTVALGGSRVLENDYGYGDGYSVIKINSQGDKLWQRIYEHPRYKGSGLLAKIALQPDGNILCGGHVSPFYSFNWIISLESTTGDMLWGHDVSSILDLPSSFGDGALVLPKACDLIVDHDGDFLLIDDFEVENYKTRALLTEYEAKNIYKLSLKDEHPIYFDVLLRDATTQNGRVIQEIDHVEVIDLLSTKTNFLSFSIQNAIPWDVDKMDFELEGPVSFSAADTDGAPYTFLGNYDTDASSLLAGERLPVGAYQLTITPYYTDPSIPGHGLAQTIPFFIENRFDICNPEGAIKWKNYLGAKIGMFAYERVTVKSLSKGGIILGAQPDGYYLSHNKSEYIFVKTDSEGEEIWAKGFGGDGNDFLRDMLELPDGSFILGGYSDSNASGDKSENSRGGKDYWIIKTDVDGNLLWEKTFGGDGDDELISLGIT